jgi:hypothetical protein
MKGFRVDGRNEASSDQMDLNLRDPNFYRRT